jgi:hypothetical protein
MTCPVSRCPWITCPVSSSSAVQCSVVECPGVPGLPGRCGLSPRSRAQVPAPVGQAQVHHHPYGYTNPIDTTNTTITIPMEPPTPPFTPPPTPPPTPPSPSPRAGTACSRSTATPGTRATPPSTGSRPGPRRGPCKASNHTVQCTQCSAVHTVQCSAHWMRADTMLSRDDDIRTDQCAVQCSAEHR